MTAICRYRLLQPSPVALNVRFRPIGDISTSTKTNSYRPLDNDSAQKTLFQEGPDEQREGDRTRTRFGRELVGTARTAKIEAQCPTSSESSGRSPIIAITLLAICWTRL